MDISFFLYGDSILDVKRERQANQLSELIRERELHAVLHSILELEDISKLLPCERLDWSDELFMPLLARNVCSQDALDYICEHLKAEMDSLELHLAVAGIDEETKFSAEEITLPLGEEQLKIYGNGFNVVHFIHAKAYSLIMGNYMKRDYIEHDVLIASLEVLSVLYGLRNSSIDKTLSRALGSVAGLMSFSNPELKDYLSEYFNTLAHSNPLLPLKQTIPVLCEGLAELSPEFQIYSQEFSDYYSKEKTRLEELDLIKQRYRLMGSREWNEPSHTYSEA